MECWMWLVVCLMIGIVVGCSLSYVKYHKKPVGTLKVDRSDPTEAPYLFLEMEPGGMDEINKSTSVLFEGKRQVI